MFPEFYLEVVEQKLSYRLTKRQGPNKCRSTVEDLIKACLDANESLPAYYAVDLRRLPPVDASHCDMSAILAELKLLRSEVRAINRIKEEVSELRQEVLQLQQLKNVKDEVKDLRRQVELMSNTHTRADPDFPALNDHTPAGVDIRPSMAVMAQRASADPNSFKKRQAPKNVIVGKSMNNSVKSVTTKRHVDVFVSRLHPCTAKAELVDCVRSVASDIKIHDVNCTKLKSKFEALYSSFYIDITVDSADLKQAVELFMSGESWPMGVFVKRYFKQKDGSTEQ